jgi:hypothetical protein
MPIDRKDYEFTKQAARSAYENAIRDAGAIGGDGIPLPDTDQHLHPDYALVDHGHEQFDHEHPQYAEEDHLHPDKADLEHEHNDYQIQIDHNSDRINALEHELEALAELKEAGEWELISLLDFDIRGSGQMTLADDDFTKNNNEITLHSTDTEGMVHNFDKVVEGDNVEIVEEHTTRGVGDYGLYEVTEVRGMTFNLKLVRGMGTATLGSHFIVKFFHLEENLDLAELDDRYIPRRAGTHEVDQAWKIVSNGSTFFNIQGGKSHLYHLEDPKDDAHAVNMGWVNTELAKKANTHSHPYASSSHSHSDVASHTHDYAASNHSHTGSTMRSGTSSNPTLSRGEQYLNTSTKVVYVGL